MQTARRHTAEAAFHPQPSSYAIQEKQMLSIFSEDIGEDIEQFKVLEEFLSPSALDASALLTPEEQRICDMATD